MFQKLRKPFKPKDLKQRRYQERLSMLGPSDLMKQPLTDDIEVNVGRFKEIFGNASDLVVREFFMGTDNDVRLVLFHIDGMVDKNAISEYILNPLLFRTFADWHGKILPTNAFQLIRDNLATASDLTASDKMDEIIDLVLYGDVAVFVQGAAQVLLFDLKEWPNRGVQEPVAESLVRGPREGFTETLRFNTSLIRRRIRTPRLKFDMSEVGLHTKTHICVTYIDGLVNPATVAEIKRRVQDIEIDGVLESGYIEDYIKDDYRTPFVLLDRTERPDKVCAALLDGRAAIVVDNTPFALIAPAVFPEFMQSTEDYYEGTEYIRPFRWLALIMTLTLPSLYVAITTFHQEMIPSSLALSIAAQREGVPFPAVVEALIMEVIFDLLREGGLRMPQPLGSVMGIVGAVVIGQAAVAAGIVSPFIVIIVAGTAISSFLIPNYSSSFAIRLLRYPMLFLAGAFGLVGIFLGLMFLLLHLASLRSFGVPYLYPLAPAVPGEWQDVFIRAPWWKMVWRPRLFRSPDRRRQPAGQQPAPPPPRAPGSQDQSPEGNERNEP
ncbi:MAG: spore germination protein [Thermacetogeniaceae bacterium]